MFYLGVLYSKEITICRIGIPGKCLGKAISPFDIGIPWNNASLIKTLNATSTVDSCQTICDNMTQCCMSAFNPDTFQCSLYRKNLFDSVSARIQIYKWCCCDTNSSYSTGLRCPGFWKHKSGARSNNLKRSLDPLVEYKGYNEEKCRSQCLRNHVCGAVNFRNFNNEMHCQLIIQYPVEDLERVEDSGWDTFQWQCADNYSLPEKSGKCAQRESHSPGEWTVQNRSIPFGESRLQLLTFYTSNFHVCLDNCALYTNCEAAWYSQTSQYCILEGKSISTCAAPTFNIIYKFTVYKWTACHKLSVLSAKKENEPTTCRTLLDNKYVYIYPITCGKLPNNASNIHACWDSSDSDHGKIFSHRNHCKTNQSFLLINAERPQLQHFYHFANVTWVNVFTGYDSFWLINVSHSNFQETEFEKCRIFNASLDVSNSEPLRIITRTEWFAAKPARPQRPLPNHPVKYLIMTDTERPVCNCFSREACSEILREIDLMFRSQFSSLHFSFLVTGDGIAYEGRGFDFEPTLAKGMRYHNFISIGLCGRYKHNPNKRMLSTVKQLINRAISLNKLSKNYTMYMYNDIIDKPYPFDGIRRVFELWPHYRGYTRPDCRPINSITLYTTIFVIMFTMTLITAIYSTFVYKIWHNKNCRQMTRCRIEQIYGSFNNNINQWLPQERVHNINKSELADIYISPLTIDVYWITDYPITYWSRDNEVNCQCCADVFGFCDLSRMQSKLVNVDHLLRLPNVLRCPRQICLVFTVNEDVNNNCLFIKHYSDERQLDQFMFDLSNGKCVCSSFQLIRYKSVPWVSHNLIREMRSEQRSECRSRDWLQERYTCLIESDNTIRYFS